MYFMLIPILILGGLMAWIRLAPSDPARWHVPPKYQTNCDVSYGAARVIEHDPARLARLDDIARHWPRTKVLAGSVGVGKITYVTRSAFWGFPDYTTVKVIDGKIVMWARSRFGRRDFGVNRKRLEAWLQALRTQG